ncbi:MAG: pilus assembly protein TadG-related protein [Rhizobiaceae bacterium]|nr:pilus assembly protein TadG-related protein [Rhizobiaceae bacterium]
MRHAVRLHLDTICNRFRKDRSGQFSLAAVAAMPMLLVATGIAVDLAGQSNKRFELQNIMDSAVLAGAALDTDSDAARKREARNVFEGALVGAGINVAAVTADFDILDDNVVNGAARMDVALSFAKMIYPNSAHVRVE